MLKKFVSLSLVGLFSTLLWAKTPDLHPSAPERYIVEKGDTLWDIAEVYLEKPWLWPFLWQQNPNIKNPDLIYPGDVLHLVWQNGKPSLVRTSKANEKNDSLVFEPIYGIDPSVLASYLTFDRLIEQSSLSTLPRVLGSQEGRGYISARDPFYIDTPLKDTFWSVYRVGPSFERQKGNKSEKMLGIVKVADAKLNRALDGLAEMTLIKQYQEVRTNDLVLPKGDDRKGQILSISPAPKGLEGQVVGHLNNTRYIGLKQIVVLDLGELDGLKPGHALLVTEKGAGLYGQKGQMQYLKSGAMESKLEALRLKMQAKDEKVYQLPPKEVASLLVIQSYPHFSLAMVARAKTPFVAPMRVIGAN